MYETEMVKLQELICLALSVRVTLISIQQNEKNKCVFVVLFALCIFRYCRKMLALEKKLIVILGFAEFANDVWHQGWGC